MGILVYLYLQLAFFKRAIYLMQNRVFAMSTLIEALIKSACYWNSG